MSEKQNYGQMTDNQNYTISEMSTTKFTDGKIHNTILDGMKSTWINDNDEACQKSIEELIKKNQKSLNKLK